MIKGHTLRGCVDWNTSSRGPPDGVTCHTLRGCVDWNRYQLAWRGSSEVTPCVGVWIETIKHKATKYNYESHPAWVCGLKHDEILKRFPEFKVTPCVGVWIETDIIDLYGLYCESHPAWVCGLKQGVNMECDGEPGSHPAWVCGLKLDLL